MKKILSILSLALFVSTASFASFQVNKNSSAQEVSTKEIKENITDLKETPKVEANSIKKVENSKSTKKEKDLTIAIILGLVSVLFLPFAFHNWYLGKKRKALWQSLMVFPGFILLLLPLIASWIWQLVDLIIIAIDGV